VNLPGALRTTAGRATALAIVVAVFVAGALILLPVLMMMNATSLSGSSADDSTTDCLTTAVAGGRSLTLDSEQIQNAGVIIKTGHELGVPMRGLVVGVATALQESTLRNLGTGDRDSVGLFQQRNGWGSFAERTDPATSAAMFYNGGRGGQPGLLDIANWRTMPLTLAAQAVQRSAFPFAYAKWEPLATSLVRSVVGDVDLGCTDAVSAALPTGAVGDMLRVALAQQGDPYLWGATGPDFFDCSGLIVYSWRQAGYELRVRTADQMFRISKPLRAGEEQPGDLLFGSFGTRVSGAGHVMIVVRPGVAVQAPAAGRVVELTRYDADGVNWRLGRLPASALTKLDVAAAA
jgi:cell wall-associated NlpC family hydrolase